MYFTNEKWQEVLASHGLIIDPTTKTLTVQSASSPADLQYDLKPEELKILTSNSLKEIPLEQRLGTLNGIIKEDFAGSITMDLLNSKESINIPLTDKAKAEIDQQLCIGQEQQQGQVIDDGQNQFINQEQQQNIHPELAPLQEGSVQMNGNDLQYIDENKGCIVTGKQIGRAHV